MEKESMISSFCRLTGISKRSLAAYIDTDQSLMTRSENGQRQLPTTALLQLTGLYTKATTPPNNNAPLPLTENSEVLKEKADWCLTQCLPLQKQLDAMQQYYQQAINTLWLLEAEENSNTILPNQKQRWIEEQRYQAQKKLQTNGWLPQKTLTIKIALLQQEARLWQEAGSEMI